MLYCVHEVRSWTEYIIGTGRRLLKIYAFQDTRHNSDHYLVLGCLRNVTLKEHRCYFGMCTQIRIRPPRQPSCKDNLFASLCKAFPKPLARECPYNYWISEDTWQLINYRVSIRRDPDRDQHRTQNLGFRVWVLLAGN